MTEGRLRSAIALFAVAGLGIAAYLTYSRYSGTQLFCATGGCETVQHSRYAVVAGVPVAVLGLVAYLAFLGTTFRGQTAAAAGVCVAVVAVLFSTYLLVAQLFLIHAVCQWCVASDVVVTILAALTAARFLVSRRLEPPTETPHRPSAVLRGPIPRAGPAQSRSERAPRGSADGASA